MTKYFELEDNNSIRGRWFLESPRDEKGEWFPPYTFTAGHPIEPPGPLKLPLRRPGKPIDFTLADSAMPVANARTTELFERIAPGAIQRIPITLEAERDPYFILNVTRTVDCIDLQATEEVEYWKPEHGRPERVGDFRMVFGLRVDRLKAGGHPLFRLKGWTIALIASEEIKLALEREKVLGPKFFPVTD